jgi:Flp pilus assembly pilin Flp
MDTTSERGQTLAEYSVVLGVLTIGIVTAIALLSGAAAGVYESVAHLIP